MSNLLFTFYTPLILVPANLDQHNDNASIMILRRVQCFFEPVELRYLALKSKCLSLTLAWLHGTIWGIQFLPCNNIYISPFVNSNVLLCLKANNVRQHAVMQISDYFLHHTI